jgi:hypothetical protein
MGTYLTVDKVVATQYQKSQSQNQQCPSKKSLE